MFGRPSAMSPADGLAHGILFLMKHIISSILYLIALLCLSVFVFDPTNLYYELEWLDIPMHIMGGFGVASLALSIASYRKQKIYFIPVFLIYIAVATGWEFYELAQDLLTSSPWNGWSDTVSDMFNGALGTAVAYYYFYLFKK